MKQSDLSEELEFLPQEEGFLGVKEEYLDSPQSAKVVVVPFGLEASTSYGAGTRTGPRAIIKASHKLEPFDEEHWSEIFRKIGIATLKEPQVKVPIEESLKQIGNIIKNIVNDNKFPLTIGGEHSITAGIIPSLIKKYPNLAILHFDAHPNLKNNYEGQHHYHTSVFRRIMDSKQVSTLISCGIRSISAEEVEYLDENKDRIKIYFSKDIDNWNINKIIEPLKGHPVYVTFDLDGFDSSLMHATSTPEPGGMYWKDVTKIIREAAKISNIVGADVVELAPIKQFYSCDFLAAKLCYKILGYAFADKK